MQEQHVQGLDEVELVREVAMPETIPPQDTDQIDRLLQRQEMLVARENAKTSAECAAEIGHVVQLTQIPAMRTNVHAHFQTNQTVSLR